MVLVLPSIRPLSGLSGLSGSLATGLRFAPSTTDPLDVTRRVILHYAPKSCATPRKVLPVDV